MTQRCCAPTLGSGVVSFLSDRVVSNVAPALAFATLQRRRPRAAGRSRHPARVRRDAVRAAYPDVDDRARAAQRACHLHGDARRGRRDQGRAAVVGAKRHGCLPERASRRNCAQMLDGSRRPWSCRADSDAEGWLMTVTKDQFEFLRSLDTPTICNLIETVAPERRGLGYTVKHLHCPFPDLPPMVGFAKTVTIRTKDKVPLGEASYMAKRLDYLDYVAAA